ncbi:hypothetical protein KIN20_024199 [Parelaphostrongylus tenuis]|uniref:Uncharacterized protein n=1 Tax=Parelaphostrongylus tenuis TaxID=148309 RepID=A0AAD5MXY8_PARTN|nr:hypothetical protein KIN20_024199 [Parelaphostrongylus tenuis]
MATVIRLDFDDYEDADYIAIAAYTAMCHEGSLSLALTTTCERSEGFTPTSQRTISISTCSSPDNTSDSLLSGSGEDSIASWSSYGRENEERYYPDDNPRIVDGLSPTPSYSLGMSCGTGIDLLQRAFSRGGSNFLTEHFWNEMNNLLVQWIEKVCSSSYERNAVILYTLNCWEILTKTCTTCRRQPSSLRRLIKFTLVDTIKFLDLLMLRGYDEVSTLLTNFVVAVLHHHLKKNGKMSEMNPKWVQSREMLRLVCKYSTNIEALFEIVHAVLEIQSRLLDEMTCDRFDRQVNLLSYQLTQINDLVMEANQRIIACQQIKPKSYQDRF